MQYKRRPRHRPSFIAGQWGDGSAHLDGGEAFRRKHAVFLGLLFESNHVFCLADAFCRIGIAPKLTSLDIIEMPENSCQLRRSRSSVLKKALKGNLPMAIFLQSKQMIQIFKIDNRLAKDLGNRMDETEFQSANCATFDIYSEKCGFILS
ncbi:hypothetical protein CEXT_30451 [Caerostris extrusa]|uniref:Uncharacterized protein n=1 Tax=Caerostris extrusa TaxID=172846 RepID=A0AAV4QSB1_CAEEX|nr:hypothetical protein CEXT_30451 [Caerostris extrusa]